MILEKAYKAPKIASIGADGKKFKHDDLEEGWLVLYFYPKDMTPGCTTESRDFQKASKQFAKLDCAVVGVSKDSPERHCKFAEKEGLEFRLLADESGALCEAFDVWKEKINYGKKYMGIERSTFLINPKKQVVAEWRKVRVADHVSEVLATLKQCQKGE